MLNLPAAPFSELSHLPHRLLVRLMFSFPFDLRTTSTLTYKLPITFLLGVISINVTYVVWGNLSAIWFTGVLDSKGNHSATLDLHYVLWISLGSVGMGKINGQ